MLMEAFFVARRCFLDFHTFPRKADETTLRVTEDGQFRPEQC